MFGRFKKRRENEWAPRDRKEPREPIDIEQKKTDETVKLVIRNNAIIEVMKEMLEKFGCKATSGRYFVPEKDDFDVILNWATGSGLYVKKSDMGSIVVVDIMRDRELRYR